MSHKYYKIRHGLNWGFLQKGQAINFCIKHDISFDFIKVSEIKTVAEVEAETGINYGCQPCTRLATGECKGEKPSTFYYPDECPSFYNEIEEEKRIEAGW